MIETCCLKNVIFIQTILSFVLSRKPYYYHYYYYFIIAIIIIIIELTHSKTILENTVEIKPQPAVLDFKNLSQYSSCST